MPKVSICIPAYNQVEHLKKCIESVLVQDYKDHEIIISDDSTTDDVNNYIESLKNPSIQYFRNSPSLGTPGNWNYVMAKATGDYIKIVHHDDFFTQPDSLKLYVESLDKNPSSDFAFSATKVLNIMNGSERIHICSSQKLNRLKSDPEYLFFGNMIGAPSATIFRRSLALKFDERYKWLVDIDFYISALRKNKNVVYIDVPLICTILGAEGQVTGQVEGDKAVQIKEHIMLLERVISNKKLERLYTDFFDELFIEYNINTQKDVENYVNIPSDVAGFLNTVFSKLNSNKLFKKIKYRLLNSKYNKHYIKIDKYKL
jgi:glycosyltransferase involved in cell wall biosynthesis